MSWPDAERASLKKYNLTPEQEARVLADLAAAERAWRAVNRDVQHIHHPRSWWRRLLRRV